KRTKARPCPTVQLQSIMTPCGPRKGGRPRTSSNPAVEENDAEESAVARRPSECSPGPRRLCPADGADTCRECAGRRLPGLFLEPRELLRRPRRWQDSPCRQGVRRVVRRAC